MYKLSRHQFVDAAHRKISKGHVCSLRVACDTLRNLDNVEFTRFLLTCIYSVDTETQRAADGGPPEWGYVCRGRADAEQLSFYL